MRRLSHISPSPAVTGRARRVVGAVAVLVGAAAGVSGAGAPSASGLTMASNWIALSPTTSPAPRTSAAMAYDPATGSVVLFGGDEVVGGGSSTLLGDTWTFDAATSVWTQQSPTQSPAPRYGASMVYDTATSDIVLFGGLGNGGDLGDTWTWNGTTWAEQAPAKSPPARSSASMAYDATSRQVVLFGGLSDRTPLGDTWTWNGSNWSERTGGPRPTARYGASMTYDDASNEAVLFGGSDGTDPLGDTWTWNGSSWTARSPSFSPPARFGASMAYDSSMTEAVLFGGYNGSNDADTWGWDGDGWSQIQSDTSPSARRFAAMDYDVASATMVLFGGDPGETIPSSLDDTWIWGSEGTFSVSLATPATLVGGEDNETATLTGESGAPAPTGTISFYVCGPTMLPAACTSDAAVVGTPVTVNASTDDTASASSMDFSPTAAGYWCFAADYSGDSNYAGITDTSDGCFSAESPVTTNPSASTVTLGATVTDVATVFGTASGGVPTGTVTFYECGPTTTASGCSSLTNQVGAPVPVNATTGDDASATSIPFAPTATGFWCFAGVYSGGGAYEGGQDTSPAECVQVDPVLTARAADATVALGTPDSDVASATGNTSDGVPTGTVTFYQCGPTTVPADCTSFNNQVGEPVTLNATTSDSATASSMGFTPSATGYWCFTAVYSGGGSYPASSDTSTDQCFDVSAVAPSFTSAARASASVQQPFSFLVTTSGAPAPTIVSSDLPAWLSLTDNGNGTATLAAGKARPGRHRITLTATNSAGSVTQTFVLTVKKL